MSGTILAIAVLSLGVTTGCQKQPDGTFAYVIQIEPQVLESMKSGREIFSDIPRAMRGVRSYLIRVGTGPVPQDPIPPEVQAAAPPSPAPNTNSLSGAAAGLFTADPPKKPAVAPSAPAASGGATSPSDKSQTKAEEPSKPWLPLSVAVAGLVMSLSANLFLGLIARDARTRYRKLLRGESAEEGLSHGYPALDDDSDPLLK